MSMDALNWFIGLENDQDYCVESAKIDFAVALEHLMESQGLRKVDLAERIGASSAYITKVMRGDANLTIRTMALLARAAGGKLCIHVARDSAKVRWVESFSSPKMPVAGSKVWISAQKPLSQKAFDLETSDDQLPLAA